MPVGLTLANIFLQNGLERLVDGLYLSIFLGVIRRRMTMYKLHLRCYLFHLFILKLTAMISDNLTWDTEPSDNLVEHEEGCSLPIGFYSRHGFDPLGNVIDNHDDVLIPPNRSWVSIDEIYPPLGEGTDSNDWVKKSRWCSCFVGVKLTFLASLHDMNAIVKKYRPKVTCSDNLLSNGYS